LRFLDTTNLSTHSRWSGSNGEPAAWKYSRQQEIQQACVLAGDAQSGMEVRCMELYQTSVSK